VWLGALKVGLLNNANQPDRINPNHILTDIRLPTSQYVQSEFFRLLNHLS
jgi:hypothetical protein